MPEPGRSRGDYRYARILSLLVSTISHLSMQILDNNEYLVSVE